MIERKLRMSKAVGTENQVMERLRWMIRYVAIVGAQIVGAQGICGLAATVAVAQTEPVSHQRIVPSSTDVALNEAAVDAGSSLSEPDLASLLAGLTPLPDAPPTTLAATLTSSPVQSVPTTALGNTPFQFTPVMVLSVSADPMAPLVQPAASQGAY